MNHGVLVDMTKCIGCGSCTVACKMYNQNKWIEHRAPSKGSSAKLADENWTVIKSFTADKNGKKVLRYTKKQCLHCEEPACVSACFAKAFKKMDNGAVVYHPNLCVGCRYCMVACSFEVPKYEWSKVFPTVTKCMMCYSRLEQDQMLACISACPTNAMTIGSRDEIIKKARDIITSDNSYINHIYGEKEAGGTSWMYISDVPFEELGFKNVSEKPVNTYTSPYMRYTPRLGALWGLVLTGLYFFNNHRKNNKGNENTTNSSIHREESNV